MTSMMVFLPIEGNISRVEQDMQDSLEEGGLIGSEAVLRL
jgi:hypothetical protein